MVHFPGDGITPAADRPPDSGGSLAVSPPWRRFKRDGVSLAFSDTRGPGPVALLLPGLTGSALEFQPTADRLSRHFRVVALDQRGHGRSTRRPDDLSRQAYVDDVIALIGLLADGAPVRLIGHAMGAQTAMLVTAQRPDLVERLVMLEGGAAGETEQSITMTMEFLSAWPLPFDSPSSAAAFLGPTAPAQAWVRDLERCLDGFRPRFDTDVMAETLRGLRQSRWPEWQGLAAPTMAVFAEHGKFSAGRRAELIARRPATFHLTLPDTGHYAHLEQFETWMTALHRFLLTSDGAAVRENSVKLGDLPTVERHG